MIIRKISLLIGSLLWTSASSSTPNPECADFERRAHAIDVAWEQRDLRLDGLALLATYPQHGCAPAERVVLVRRVLSRTKRSPLFARILLLQGMREYRLRAFTRPNLVAQIALLEELDGRRMLRLAPRERSRLQALAERSWSGDVEAVFREYHALAAQLIARQ